MINKRALGYIGENIAAHFLQARGMRVIESNFTVSGGEIDLIARDRDEIVFIEVKTRGSNTFGYGEDSIGYFKRKSFRRALRRYLYRHPNYRDCRIDFVDITLSKNGGVRDIEHYEDIGE